jgi:hypothetical protein
MPRGAGPITTEEVRERKRQRNDSASIFTSSFDARSCQAFMASENQWPILFVSIIPAHLPC